MSVKQLADVKAQGSELKLPNVGSLMLYQLLSRILTFLMNSLILRLASPLVLGIGSIKLELFIGTILYLSRDGIRMALLRMSPPENNEKASLDRWRKRFVRLAWMSFPIGVSVTLVMAAIFLKWPPAEIIQSEVLMRLYKVSILLYSISALLELCIEPVMSQLLYHHQTKARLTIDFVSLFFRMLVILLLIFKNGKPDNPIDEMKLGMSVFAMGQIVRTLVLVTGLVYANLFVLNQALFSILPSFSIPIDGSSMKLALEMTKQLILKYALAQGDMWIVGSLCKVSDQGVYSVVINYGSLICRLILQPLEESGLQFFSKAFSGNDKANRTKAISHLGFILKFHTIISILLIFVAPWYTNLIVRIFLGQKWASSTMPTVLTAYCLQIPSMAFCGILESFMNATISSDWYRITRVASLSFSGIFIGTALLTAQSWGTIGLIAANTLSFTLRAILGFLYLRNLPEWAELSIIGILPNSKLIGCLMVITGISAASSGSSLMNNFSVALLSITIISMSLLTWEKAFLLKMRDILLNRGEKIKAS